MNEKFSEREGYSIMMYFFDLYLEDSNEFTLQLSKHNLKEINNENKEYNDKLYLLWEEAIQKIKKDGFDFDIFQKKS